MGISGKHNNCSRCRKSATGKEEICSRCIGDLLDIHDHLIGWKLALEIEREEAEVRNFSIEIQ
jgi:predicted amidophosphoribosyltransferase